MKIPGKFLGIDYGTKRVGLALSDQNGRLAFPKEVVKNNGELFRKIGIILSNEKISEIVVGESFDFTNLPNALMKEIGFFVSKLEKKFKIPVYLQKEFLTSVEARRYLSFGGQARRYGNPEEHVDASAAALILQRYLDKKNQQNNGGNSEDVI
ncbi:MAG: putative holliday junction resolvase [Parcubacteria group bacterium Gr01-1014_24]|nr:MAG: putative holliday junction resolvase [Parcubacteria group bacterium Gr01-1014_24]